jgi:hypothetical protein
VSESASDLGPLLGAMTAAGERFIVIVGPGLSDPSAVPLPFVTNPTSPSLLELLRRELVSRGGEGLADRLLAAHDEDDLTTAPTRLALLLRSLAASPDERDELVLAFERDKRPAATHRALAALAQRGRLSRLVSACYDHLLPWTF